MKGLFRAERYLLIGHILSMGFGLAGLLLVLPNADFIANLPGFGKTAFSWSMAGGGVAYMIFGAAAVAIYAYRTLGIWHALTFIIPAIIISLVSELSGTSTGFPFGHYEYLSGLGYKIAGLVPFTIPLSWFYLGFSAYLLALAGFQKLKMPSWLYFGSAIATGAILLTSWDFVLDPGMTQGNVLFWVWEQEGAFFGMPYQNFVGWFGTGALFMSVATIFWKTKPFGIVSTQLGLPLIVYLSNFAFAAIMSIGAGIYLPILLGLISGVIPALVLFGMARSLARDEDLNVAELTSLKMPASVK